MRFAKPALLSAAVLAALVTAPATAARAASGSTRQSHVTAVGLHNTYQKAAFPYLADGLDSGTGLIEMDIWVFSGQRKWRVSHDLPLVDSSNNCMSSGLRGGRSNQLFDVCLDNLRLWHDQHPDHHPITVKVEMKNGFNVQAGASATDFDDLVRAKLGDSVFTPARLLGGYRNVDEAAKADNWPARSELSGKFIFEIIPGTFERQNPFDHLTSDIEYARHLRDTPQTAMAFPAVLDAQAGDPRTRYAETDIRPWFVFFDGAAASYVNGGIDAKWYDDNHYYLVMTAAHEVAPPLDSRSPDVTAADQRVADMAAAHASIVSTDWYDLDEVVGKELDRG
jgi:hypothetical protein